MLRQIFDITKTDYVPKPGDVYTLEEDTHTVLYVEPEEYDGARYVCLQLGKLDGTIVGHRCATIAELLGDLRSSAGRLSTERVGDGVNGEMYSALWRKQQWYLERAKIGRDYVISHRIAISAANRDAEMVRLRHEHAQKIDEITAHFDSLSLPRMYDGSAVQHLALRHAKTQIMFIMQRLRDLVVAEGDTELFVDMPAEMVGPMPAGWVGPYGEVHRRVCVASISLRGSDGARWRELVGDHLVDCPTRTPPQLFDPRAEARREPPELTMVRVGFSDQQIAFLKKAILTECLERARNEVLATAVRIDAALGIVATATPRKP